MTSEARTIRVDVAVIGGGLAGMAAAVTAAKSGASVLVLERGPFVGGSAAISMGFVWALKDREALAVEDPGLFQRHGSLTVDALPQTLEWLGSHTVALSEPRMGNVGPGQRFDLSLLFSNLTTALAQHGGQLIVSAEVTSAKSSDGRPGFVLHCVSPEEALVVQAASVVLATGGRQGDPRVRRELVGGGYTPALRGNPFSTGGGAVIGRQLGAALNLENKGFYGHLFPSGLTPTSPLDFVMLAQYHSDEGILLDAAGVPVADMSHDHINALRLARTGGRGLLLWSSAVQERASETAVVPGGPKLDRWRFAKQRGAKVVVAPNMPELAAAVRPWGYAIVDSELHLPGAVKDSPIYGMEVEIAVTFTFGGVVVDDAGVAMTDDGLTIPGLYAVGADMSDAYHEGYGGGLNLAVATGRRAGQSAANRAAHAIA